LRSQRRIASKYVLCVEVRDNGLSNLTLVYTLDIQFSSSLRPISFRSYTPSLHLPPPLLLPSRLPPLPSHPESERYHALLTSHHLKSPAKRRSLASWASQRALAGFAKLGHPGVIYVSGPRPGVDRFVRDVRAMQWLALRVRFVEPLPGDDCETPEWTELEKVGEVVEWMRARGRERFVVEMGIGSAGSSSAK
jgi:hypothetical protein